MNQRPKKLLDQACTEIVEVSVMSSESSITPSAPNKPTLTGSNVTSCSTRNDTRARWAPPELRLSSPIWLLTET
jgi:hypothetical protein